jgi:hypothetical protein
MASSRLMYWEYGDAGSFTQYDIGPITIDFLNAITTVRTRGGITFNSTDVADFGGMPAFVLGVQTGAAGYTPYNIDDSGNWNNWIFLGHCRSVGMVGVISGTAGGNVGEVDTFEEEWHGQRVYNASTDFYVSIATNPYNTAGTPNSHIQLSLEILYN